MSETKYGKNFISGIPEKLKEQFAMREKAEGSGKTILYTNGEYNPGVNFCFAGWVSNEGINPNIHSHPHDEYMGFFGSDPDHPEELNAEIEYTLGGEKHTITRSCVIFIPAGVSHFPAEFKKVDKPIFCFITTPIPFCINENVEISQD